MKDNIPSGNLSPLWGDHRGSPVIIPYISSVLNVGSIPLGGTYPIRLQSMTNTDTMDTKASVAQCIRIIEAGADFVRLTAQGTREALNLAEIKKELGKAGFETPLIADIHFNPAAAETAARIVEKVRINPGNYTDKRASFQSFELTDKEYNEELERMHSRLLPLINICREYGTVIRIGINHGSLSDRIMTRFGNTPEGMVRSALEFIDVFRQENFSNLVLSMKSSDTSVMVRSTRMLVAAMQDIGASYPLHLGVTEAGEGEDGRIRSAAGIGALLADGIGDTIRVSLSEDPENEIPVAGMIADLFPKGTVRPGNAIQHTSPERKSELFRVINGPLVLADLRTEELHDNLWSLAGFAEKEGKISGTDSSADLVLTSVMPRNIPDFVKIAVPYRLWKMHGDLPNVFPVFSPEEPESPETHSGFKIVLTGPEAGPEVFSKYPGSDSLVIFSFATENRDDVDDFMSNLAERDSNCNIILNPLFNIKDIEEFHIKAASILGKYVIDNSIAGIMISNKALPGNDEPVRTAFSILQNTDKRITRTIYLSCPTCGRTKFNLQDTVRKVKAATGHLKGLKIAVMGCIVNGPGEMAGADYGYVGAAPGKVHIYKGTVPVLKNVPEEEAIRELLRVIGEDTNSPLNPLSKP